MKKYILKWVAASLIAPLLVMLTSGISYSENAQSIVLLFWPSSIFLMTLGGSKNEMSQVIYIWGAAVASNMTLYAFVGYIISVVKGVAKHGT